jgi:endonuclease V-like protein UPF0215 family
MIDGTALGGFNVVDIDNLSRATGVPFCTVTRDRPDLESMRVALQKNFSDWKRRFEKVERHALNEVRTEHGTIFISVSGTTVEEAQELVHASTLQGSIPEPLRLAHLIATAMVKGESKGNS